MRRSAGRRAELFDGEEGAADENEEEMAAANGAQIGANSQAVGSNDFGVGFRAEKFMIKFRLLLLTLLVMVWTLQARAQFGHTDHRQIVDAGGKPLLVRATNLGNWMVPEGYMWLFKDGPQSPDEIRALVLELLGPEGSEAFWQKWRENYVTREDIALLHRAGFNAIRVPLHYSLFESDDAEGFHCWIG